MKDPFETEASTLQLNKEILKMANYSILGTSTAKANDGKTTKLYFHLWAALFQLTIFPLQKRVHTCYKRTSERMHALL